MLIHERRLEKVLGGHELEGDIEAQEIESCLNIALVETRRTQVESLDHDFGPSKTMSRRGP